MSDILTLACCGHHTRATCRRAFNMLDNSGEVKWRRKPECRGSDRSRLRSAWFSSSQPAVRRRVPRRQRPRPLRPPLGRPVPAQSAPPASAAAVATPAPRQAFKGVNVNLLTFNGPQVAEPLQRRAPDFEALTGAHVNVVAVGFQTIYDKALLDASTARTASMPMSSTRSGWATSSARVICWT